MEVEHRLTVTQGRLWPEGEYVLVSQCSCGRPLDVRRAPTPHSDSVLELLYETHVARAADEEEPMYDPELQPAS